MTSEALSFCYDTQQIDAGSFLLKIGAIDINIYSIDNSHFYVI